MQLNPIHRRGEDLPQTVRYAHKPSTEQVFPIDTLAGFNSANWILDLPESLVEMKDFHFAVSASFRMTQSMGDELIFDEVR